MELESLARKLAKSLDLNLDADVYRAASRDPLYPLLYGGNPAAPIGFYGRDPGKEEIRAGEPLIGAAGKRVRAGIFRHYHGGEPRLPEDFKQTSEDAFYANTVPYKQVANKAWGLKVTARFSELISSVLIDVWKGNELITLGNEAFHWFKLAGEKVANKIDAHWKLEDRYERSLQLELTSAVSGSRKLITLYPLPHPSPLNQTWYSKFPALIDARLKEIRK